MLRTIPYPRRLAVLLAVTVLATRPATADGRSADLEATLRAFDRAQFSNDVAALATLFADDYVLVNSDASVEDKTQAIADFRQPGFKTEPYALEQPVRLLSADAAVVAGLVHLRWTQGGAQHTRTVRMATVWMKRDGRWQATYTQVTRVPET